MYEQPLAVSLKYELTIFDLPVATSPSQHSLGGKLYLVFCLSPYLDIKCWLDFVFTPFFGSNSLVTE